MNPAKLWWIVAGCVAVAAAFGVGFGVAGVRARRPVRGLDALPAPPLPAWRTWFRAYQIACPWAAGWPGVAIFGGGAVVTHGVATGWMPRPPGGGVWMFHAIAWAVAAMYPWAALETWRTCRTRWAVRDLGERRLAAGHLDADFAALASTIAPPVLKRPGEERGATGGLLLALVGGPVLAGAVLASPWLSWSNPPVEALLVTFAQAAVIAWMAVVIGVGAAWRLPRGVQRWLTDEGAVTRTLAVRWADAARVAVADVPAGAAKWLPAGSVALEVCDGERAERFFAGPEVRGELDRLLAAVPPDRLVRAGAA